jgi:hypothetical protein
VKRVTRREFLRLASIWSVVPFLSGRLNITNEDYDATVDEEPSEWSEDTWRLTPYYYSPSVNSEYYWHNWRVTQYGVCDYSGCWCKTGKVPVWVAREDNQ